MCVQLISSVASAAGDYYAATAEPTPNDAAATRQTAGNLAAAAGAVDALSGMATMQVRAKMARADGAAEAAAGRQRAQRIRRAGDAAVGESRAAVGASGVRLTSSSVLEAERALQRAVETDAGVAIVNGQSRAQAADLQALYMEQAGYQTLLRGAAESFGNWRRSRAPRAEPARPFNPIGDGFYTDPQAGP